MNKVLKLANTIAARALFLAAVLVGATLALHEANETGVAYKDVSPLVEVSK